MDNIEGFRNDYAFLSNFYFYEFEYKNIIFKNSEQAYQWEKASTESDKLLILQCSSAKNAKQIGYKVKCDIKKWDSIKINIMEEIVKAKFSNEYLKQKLIKTGKSNLIEKNFWHDNYWGICYCTKCKGTIGNNNLGKILMKIRS